VPPTGAYAAVGIWCLFVALSGAYAVVLGPGRAMTRYQLPSLGSVQAKGTGCNSSWYIWSGPLICFFSGDSIQNIIHILRTLVKRVTWYTPINSNMTQTFLLT